LKVGIPAPKQLSNNGNIWASMIWQK